MKMVESPSVASDHNRVLIGKDSRGRWVAREQHGRFGGLFLDRAQAVKYALRETGHDLRSIVDVPQQIAIDIFASPIRAARPIAA